VSTEREPVAETLRHLRDSVRDEVAPARTAGEVLPPLRDVAAPTSLDPPAEPAPAPLPPHPDGTPVNAAWDLRAVPPPSGWRGRVARLLCRLLAPLIEHQTQFNSHQVQLDNQFLEYLDARLELTHRHYDSVLGMHGRHMQDIDQRHVELQAELVRHVHDLVRRIDIVLAEGEKNRVALEAALRDVRARLSDLERRAGDKPTR
jgi:hypothetical protein